MKAYTFTVKSSQVTFMGIALFTIQYSIYSSVSVGGIWTCVWVITQSIWMLYLFFFIWGYQL